MQMRLFNSMELSHFYSLTVTKNKAQLGKVVYKLALFAVSLTQQQTGLELMGCYSNRSPVVLCWIYSLCLKFKSIA